MAVSPWQIQHVVVHGGNRNMIQEQTVDYFCSTRLVWHTRLDMA
jgi:hypothetical protein